MGANVKEFELCPVGDMVLLKGFKQGCDGVSFVFYTDLLGMVC